MDTKHTQPVPYKDFLLPPYTSFENLHKHPNMLFCSSFNSLLLLYMTYTKHLWGVCMTIKPSHYASTAVELEQQNDHRGSEWSGLLRTTELKGKIQIFLPVVAGQ
jgi:hypothetical protein